MFNKILLSAHMFSIVAQVEGIARGLEYLHDAGVIHGDLRGVREFVFEGMNNNLTFRVIGQCSDRP